MNDARVLACVDHQETASIVHACVFPDPAGYCLVSLSVEAVYVDLYTSGREDRNGCQEKGRKPRRAPGRPHAEVGAGSN